MNQSVVCTCTWSHTCINTVLYYRQGLDSNVLRFVAQMKPPSSSRPSGGEPARQFIVFYYLSDDTIAVFEPPVRNSGEREREREGEGEREREERGEREGREYEVNYCLHLQVLSVVSSWREAG